MISVGGDFGSSLCQSGVGMGHPCHRGVEAGGRWCWCCGPRGGLGHHSILLHMSTVWDGGGGEDGYRDRQPGEEREVPDDNGTAGAAFSCPALQGTEGNQARASEAKNG